MSPSSFSSPSLLSIRGVKRKKFRNAREIPRVIRAAIRDGSRSELGTRQMKTQTAGTRRHPTGLSTAWVRRILSNPQNKESLLRIPIST